jgi:transposase-like protein
MAEKEGSKFLSETEQKRFDAMARFDTIKAAALFLGVSPSTLYNWRSKLKERYKARRSWINAIESQRRRSENINRIFSERKSIDPLEELWEEE